MKRIALALVGFLALAGVLGFLVTRPRGGAPSEAGGVVASEEQRGVLVAGDEAVVAAAPEAAPGGGGGALVDIGTVPLVGPNVVKNASLELVVPKDGFERAFEQAQLVAGRYGGFVVSSSSSGTKVRSGSLMIRVPNASFEEALADLRDLGDVEGESISGQDVSAEFVDLEARLRTWETQESVLLRLMEQATSVEATLRIQRELQDVQLRIEQIRGQLRVLRDRVELATISLSLHEPGVVIRKQLEAAERRPDLGEAWARAVDGFLGVFYVVVVGLGYLIPITALATAVWLAVRRWSRPRPTPGLP